MKLKKILRLVRTITPVVIANAPVVIRAIKQVKRVAKEKNRPKA